ncbi:Fur family transcriptional regulator [Arcobacter sp. FWKO B]|uniref:Fur family transcriptional regulator n=1 Tax=Arcobacter sp. FWKO B TaxID=2593672 RepID=UPI0018A4CA00|nr:transcriptional repressor [Arcobacter sp. FWKO B]QOG11829.1 transcriptional repressor [Arcobacter sp. FWKO B]
MQNLFQFTNIKPTNARIELVTILKKSTKPISYDDIKDSLSMDKATFYRNIILFEEEGLVNSFESNDKKRYYEITSNPHPHFVCKVCNKIECLAKLMIDLPQHRIDNVTISGICRNCLKI